MNATKAVLTVLGLVMVSSSAFATHAYRSQECSAQGVKLRYTGNYPVGGAYEIYNQNANAESLKALASDEEGGDDPDSVEVVFSTVSSVNIGDSKQSSECYFDHEEWHSRKEIKFEKVSALAAKALGLQQGTVLTMNCDESFDTPNGNHCEDN